MYTQAFVRRAGRLALYCKAGAEKIFWESNWSELSEETLKHSLRNTKRLGIHTGFFKRWLPHDGLILEAGCGYGLWVNRLRNNGWRSIGIDYSPKTLIRSKKICPILNLAAADVFQLPFKDGAIAAYLSLGVVEHFKEGPKPILAECARILKSKGVALVSVPYANSIRRKTRSITEEEAEKSGLEFYQYFFSTADLAEQMEAVGLVPCKVFHGYGVRAGLSGAHSILKNIFKKLGVFGEMIELIPGLPRLAAHMVFVVAQRK